MEVLGDMTLARAAPELSDDLVSKIVAKMPLPSIFKARCLTKEWYSRFSLGVSAQDDEEEKRLAASFQADVRREVCKRGVLLPVYISFDEVVGYDCESKSWRQLPSASLSFIPKELLDAAHLPGCGIPDSGLVLEANTPDPENVYLIVANIFTETWKSLPPHRFHGRAKPCLSFGNQKLWFKCRHARLLRDTSTGPYKVLSVTGYYERDIGFGEGYHWFAHIYDSTTNAWSNSIFHLEHGEWPSCWCYLKGVLYMMKDERLSSWSGVGKLLTLNVEDGTYDILQLRFDNPPHLELDNLLERDVVAWNGGLFIVVLKKFHEDRGQVDIHILKVDLESKQLLEVSKGPPDSFKDGHRFHICGIRGRFIYFSRQESSRVIYDLAKDDWSLLKFPMSPSDDIKATFAGASKLVDKIDSGCRSRSRSRQLLGLVPGFDPFWQV